MVSYVKESGEANYSQEVIAQIEQSVQEKENKGGKGASAAAADTESSDEDELLPAAEKLAETIAKNAPIAVRACKKAINDGISLPIEKAVEVEEKLFGDCFETHDQQEGMACFLSREKPKPKAVFTNN